MIKEKTNMKLAAFILNLITTITCGILLIPLIWMIPMTIKSYKIYKGEEEITTGFAICDLLFVDIISGILLLIAQDENSTNK